MDWTPVFQEKASEYTSDIWTVRFDDRIVPDQPKKGWKQYRRKSCGRFRCSKCKRTWPSNLVMVVFHMHLNRRTHQGTIKVRRYRQNCKICRKAPMETPTFEDRFLDSLLESLLKYIRKNFYHEDLGDRHEPNDSVEVKSPHEPKHCEGCKAGICAGDVGDMTNAFHQFRL